MKFKHLTSIIPIVIISCGGNSTETDNKGHTDSINTEKATIPYSLPDTTIESAQAIKYSVNVFDSIVNGKIANTNDLYASTNGVYTFRGGAKRQADFNGQVKGIPSEIKIDWEFTTDTDYRETDYGKWGGGSGWTGQPLYVEWTDSCIEQFNHRKLLLPGFSKKEIIIGSLDNHVYFIDFISGKASRKPIDVHNPIKGTVSLDPTNNGNLYVGQGIPAERPFGAAVINLQSHIITDFFKEDPNALRHWDAYDSSPVRVDKFLFRPGENGSIYKFIVTQGVLKLHSVLRYTINGAAPGIESSMSVYLNYGYICDNHGNIICINLDNLKPIWRYYLGDDTDATPVLAIENNHPYIYTGCEIDRTESPAKFVKIDGLNGSKIWSTTITGKRFDIDEKHFDGGFYATALLGSGNSSSLIFSNCVKNSDGQNGEFIALDRNDGHIVYTTKLKYYSWSSPVGFLNEKGEMFVFTADSAGNVYIINASDGKILLSKHIGNNFESSPVVAGNSIVIGSRGQSIYKLSIR